jgi:hypothetical protein
MDYLFEKGGQRISIRDFSSLLNARGKGEAQGKGEASAGVVVASATGYGADASPLRGLGRRVGLEIGAPTEKFVIKINL